MDDNRNYMRQNSFIYLKKQGIENSPEYKFQIVRFLGAGGSSVCYKARMTDEKNKEIPGTLKEFYPCDNSKITAYWLEREASGDERANNQLHSKGSITNGFFIQARDLFLHTYNKIEDCRMKFEDLFAPIANFDIFKGLGEGDNFTYYVWIPYDVEVETFGQYLKTVCADMNKGVGKTMHLKMILESIKNLSCSIKAVHTADLRHLDITPSNFGLHKINNGVTSAVSLIDVNTMYSNSRDKILRSRGTPGFRSPLLNDKLDIVPVGLDIFSIGACLFYALVMEQNAEEDYENICFLYKKKEEPAGEDVSQLPTKRHTDSTSSDELDKDFHKMRYDSIEELIARSPIFRDCDATEDRILQNQIVTILKKCLSPKSKDNYQGVTLLIEDLEKAIGYLGLIDGMETVRRNERDVVVMKFRNKEELISEDSKLGATGAIWNFLYDMPLYKYADNGKLNILVMGLGIYASKFIDIAFQLVQTGDFFTEITVVSKEAQEDKKRFLATHPEYPNFFEIDGEKAGKVSDSPYGRIRFLEAAFSENANENEERLKAISEKTGLDYGFCFAAMHSDKLNQNAASAAKNVFWKPGKKNFMAGFAVFGDKDKKGHQQFVMPEKIRRYAYEKKLFPVDINMTVDKHPDYKLLKRMAFNAHLVWTEGLEDIEYSKNKFRKPDNWESSFANAVSIKYKLSSMGIEFDAENPENAAGAFLAKISRDDSLMENLVMFEHRRWNIERMSKGWTCLPEEKYSELKSATKDEKGKRHPCIVPSFISSEPKASLSDESWEEDNRRKWNNHTEADIDLLDPLDRVSVMLHESFNKMRDNEDRTRLHEQIDEISDYLAGEPSLRKIYSSYVLSVNALFESRKKAGTYESTKALINSYKYYLRTFKKMLKTHGESIDKDKIEKLIKEADKTVFPTLEAQAYTNFKKKDEALIRNIPFILTYTTNMRFLIPLVTENVNEYSTTELFNNVAVALMTSPKYITYAIEANTLLTNLSGVVSALRYVKNTLKNHMIPARISALVLTGEHMKKEAIGALDLLFKEFPELHSGDILAYPSGAEHMYLENYLKARSRSSEAYTAVQNNDSKISGYLSGCRKNSREIFPSFTFDSNSQSFECIGNCEFLKYIPFKPSLRTEDIFLSKGKVSVYEEPELQKSYKDLWNLYKSNPGNSEKEEADSKKWKAFCKHMKQFSEQKQETLMCETGEFVKLRQTIPSVFKDTFEKLIVFFKGENMAGNYRFSYINSSTVELEAELIQAVKIYLEKLLTDHMEDLFDPDCFEPEKRGSRIYIPHGNLFFRGVNLPKDTASKDAMLFILNRLSALGLISGYKNPQPNATSVNFMCVSPEVKKLITVEGYLFEIYCYYSLIETGYFDEVRTSLTVKWNELNLASEFDIVAIKNFKTVLIECKTVEEIDQGFYNKLFALKNIFGINSTAVLVADMCCQHGERTAFQRTRGDAYGIKTVSTTREIYCKRNALDEFPGIGHTIASFLE